MSQIKEDVQIRLAHDILRGHGHVDDFMKGLKQQMGILEDLLEDLNSCNDGNLQEVMMDLESVASWSDAVIDEMVLLIHELKDSALSKTSMFSVNDHYAITPVDYVR